MKFIIGKKIEMTQKFNDSGEVIPVTVIKAGPCKVTQIKSDKKDGYSSIQVGFGYKKNINKPLTGHLNKLGNFAVLKEFKNEKQEAKVGDIIKADTFEKGEKVKITGVSKGKGFQGVVKRHGFSGMPKSHGTKDQLRMPGSIGATGPAHVFKGVRMPGQTGNKQITTSGLEIFDVDIDNNLIYIKGAVPGSGNSYVFIKGLGDLKLNTQTERTEKEKTEEVSEKKEKENNDNIVKEAEKEEEQTEEKEKQISGEKKPEEQKEEKNEEKEINK